MYVGGDVMGVETLCVSAVVAVLDLDTEATENVSASDSSIDVMGVVVGAMSYATGEGSWDGAGLATVCVAASVMGGPG